MGIPSYFSYIIKNYTNIIRKQASCEKIQHLLMDCNSIVYDAFRELEENYKKEPFDISTIEEKLIEKTILKIKEYIIGVSPEKTAFITFDGVAPFAKMEQQRIRRYKTQATVSSTSIWNTTAITPGTKFMDKLSSSVYKYFKDKKLVDVKHILISCSDEVGEGEHKLFDFVRKTDCSLDTIAVYGLDADLIMLSIFHQQFCRKIYVFREAPTFKTVLSCQYDERELLFMDILGLSNSIFQEMGNYDPLDKNMRVTDYIFMCFLLGNDFLPHFPALNIRVHGMQILMDSYYQCIGRFRDRSFINPATRNINWKYVGIFLTEIAKNEHRFLLKEYEMRDRFSNKKWPSKTDEDKENLLLNIPIIYRQDEQYICPTEQGWEARYYSRLLNISENTDKNTQKNNTQKIKDVCINYLEGLEWVYRYYTSECPDWTWKYKYSYPPLLKDLSIFVPTNNKTFLTLEKTNPIKPFDQLCYVLPYSQLHLLPSERRDKIISEYSHLYPTQYQFKWAFCRYFWEAHPVLPELDTRNIIVL
jgi:5'-3' exonuclease